MASAFARIGAVTGMKVEDAFMRQRRLWLRLNEKGGKVHEMPCHHTLEEYLHAYIDGCNLVIDPKGPLFLWHRPAERPPLPQANAYAMTRCRAAAAGIQTRITATFSHTPASLHCRNRR